ncbi:hypothetical protein pb186bvf_004088 [Paramecium bursaria]
MSMDILWILYEKGISTIGKRQKNLGFTKFTQTNSQNEKKIFTAKMQN